ncbi:MAG: WXG100 family type VII secretion target [Lachnospiraceae bacterium]|nr:WXG100 family type VII secretion target [Lachnospiraceae bacterium]
MSNSTVNINKMKTASTELDKIAQSLAQQVKKLSENTTALRKVWHGEAANTYITAVTQNEQNFQQLTNSIRSASSSLKEITTSYSRADAQASEIVKNRMGRG